MNVKKKTISLELALSRVSRFRERLVEVLPDSQIPRAILIPIEDLLEIVDRYRDPNDEHKHKIKGVRAYLSIKEDVSPVVKQNEVIALIVPVTHDGKDIIFDPVNDDETEIYDFTGPCPSECDESSPLFIK